MIVVNINGITTAVIEDDGEYVVDELGTLSGNSLTEIPEDTKLDPKDVEFWPEIGRVIKEEFNGLKLYYPGFNDDEFEKACMAHFLYDFQDFIPADVQLVIRCRENDVFPVLKLKSVLPKTDNGYELEFPADLWELEEPLDIDYFIENIKRKC